MRGLIPPPGKFSEYAQAENGNMVTGIMRQSIKLTDKLTFREAFSFIKEALHVKIVFT